MSESHSAPKDIQIVGGSYHEYCQEPYWNEFYGSGLRAAAALAGCCSVQLHTYCDAESLIQLNAQANAYGFSVEHEAVEKSVSFKYKHCLSIPKIFPSPNKNSQLPDIEVAGNTLLRFGMLEGSSKVTGDYVVYDPQSAFMPEHFHANGSKASHLALIANRSEMSKLIEGDIAVDAIRSYMGRNNIEVVLVKNGPEGAHVITQESESKVPAFKTERVWKIGSGDVFSAGFAYFWGLRKESAHDAGLMASRCAAKYCGEQFLPLPIKEIPHWEPTPVVLSDTKRKKKVYLASPFFSSTERSLVNEIRSLLMSFGLNVFSPFHDVGIGPATEIAEKDLSGLESSDLVFAVLDGFDPGTLFEIGYARAKKIPVICLREYTDERDLKMFEGSHCLICPDLVSAIYQASWAAVET